MIKNSTNKSAQIVLYCFLCLFLPLIAHAQQLNDEERKLYTLILKYRTEKGLRSIPFSSSLTLVAQMHVKDLFNNRPDQGNCNPHSWSSKGSWTPCCYSSDHSQAACMWSKPKELTSYKGNGYEIAFWASDEATAAEALESWINSPGHNEVIINQGIWKGQWNAIGVGLYKNYAVVWFGNELDTK